MIVILISSLLTIGQRETLVQSAFGLLRKDKIKNNTKILISSSPQILNPTPTRNVGVPEGHEQAVRNARVHYGCT